MMNSILRGETSTYIYINLYTQAAEKYNPECTFKPKITTRSSNLQSRSVVELSRGDQLKRETTLRLAKLRAEQVKGALLDAAFDIRKDSAKTLLNRR